MINLDLANVIDNALGKYTHPKLQAVGKEKLVFRIYSKLYPTRNGQSRAGPSKQATFDSNCFSQKFLLLLPKESMLSNTEKIGTAYGLKFTDTVDHPIVSQGSSEFLLSSVRGSLITVHQWSPKCWLQKKGTITVTMITKHIENGYARFLLENIPRNGNCQQNAFWALISIKLPHSENLVVQCWRKERKANIICLEASRKIAGKLNCFLRNNNLIKSPLGTQCRSRTWPNFCDKLNKVCGYMKTWWWLSQKMKVSTFNSGYDGPVAMGGSKGQTAVDHGLFQLCHRSEKEQRSGCNVEIVQSGFIPSASKYQRMYSISHIRLKTFNIVILVVATNQFLTNKTNCQQTYWKPKYEDLLKMSSSKNYRTRCQ